MTEEPWNPVMWSHYAQDYSGFVVAFDIYNPWFWNDTEFKNCRVQRVIYNDLIISEMLDIVELEINPFCRKRSFWKYENEWRIIERSDKASSIVIKNEKKLHLFEVPKEGILGVIVGHKMLREHTNQIIFQKVMSLPHLQLHVIQPDPSKGLLCTVEITG